MLKDLLPAVIVVTVAVVGKVGVIGTLNTLIVLPPTVVSTPPVSGFSSHSHAIATENYGDYTIKSFMTGTPSSLKSLILIVA